MEAQDGVAGEILAALGGAGNVSVSTHCTTRLRITVADPDAVDEARLSGVAAVLGVARGGDQVQVVVGPGVVAGVHAALERARAAASDAGSSPDTSSRRAEGNAPRARVILRPLYLLIDIVTPLLPVFAPADSSSPSTTS
ncbi:PTS transporter subunit EIIB [Microbacterium aurum]